MTPDVKVLVASSRPPAPRRGGSNGVELQPCGEEWPILRAQLIAHGHKGNEVTDAWIASATESSSEHLVTFDRDFLNLLSPGDFTLLTAETDSD